MIETMIGHNVAGLIISPAYGDVTAAFDALSHAQIPAIQVMRQVDDRTDRFPFWPRLTPRVRGATRHDRPGRTAHCLYRVGWRAGV